jgi:zinc D-Ala-D-Ala carboxypeptidase
MSAHDWKLTPSFKPAEMACKCGRCDGLHDMNADFMLALQAIRDQVGPLRVTSGYRCRQHPNEVQKIQPGSHAQGRAADIHCVDSLTRFTLVRLGIELGMTGIGIARTFIHLDNGHANAPRPAIWEY